MNYTISLATQKDLDTFLCLQDDVAARMSESTHFAQDDGNSFEKCVSGKGYVFLVKEGEVLIACCMLQFPDADDEDNLGFDLSFSHDKRQHVAHLESLFISSTHQGRGVASELLERSLRCALDEGRHEILATVHPCNCASLKRFFSSHFFISGFAYKYGNLPRVIMRYQPALFSAREVALYVLCDDFHTHNKLISQGMRGVCIRETCGAYSIGYSHV